ncbi:class I SAM-dependent methyltransferase [Dubosiella muris]|uniref:Methyltransferase domain-containing protein n=1 Tax=Dubosiella muris TaxID=3038133 RepID=A0AC61RAX0_9FIRM|nr:methyltransferase [Dubosiella muris]TGY67304.1 methyltransferase domain-containing protein [Dubosiella muris]
MAHYFTNDDVKDRPFDIGFEIDGRSFTLHSNQGVFSKDKLDEGTRLLLETVLDHETDPRSILDLGCGIGVVGVVLQSRYHTDMTMIDINARAVQLAKANMEKYGLKARVEAQDGIQTGVFDCIVFNPPIRIGKPAMYALLDSCVEHLSEHGRLWLVMRKQHGAPSAVKHFEEAGCRVERVTRDKGYWILLVRKK